MFTYILQLTCISHVPSPLSYVKGPNEIHMCSMALTMNKLIQTHKEAYYLYLTTFTCTFI